MNLPEGWRRIADHAIEHESGKIRISGAGKDSRKYSIWMRSGPDWNMITPEPISDLMTTILKAEQLL